MTPIARKFLICGVGPLILLATMAASSDAGAVSHRPSHATDSSSPAVGGATELVLTSVSCVSSTNCLAVGSYTTTSSTVSVALAWNGHSWRTLPKPPGTGVLSAVSCASATSCMAVGTAISAAGPTVTVAELWNGSRWRTLDTPNRASDDLLDSVSCPSPKECIAVGWYGMGHTLAEIWNGTRWQLMKTGPAGSQFGSVSCSGPANCLAVGVAEPAGVAKLLTEVWNGSEWRVATPPGYSNGIGFVACTSDRFCLGVGSNTTSSGHPAPAAAMWKGTRWLTLHPVTPSGRGGLGLDGLSCTSATHCIVVGNAGGPVVAEEWNGTTWHTIGAKSAIGDEPASNLFGVSCPTARWCMAVGDYFTASSPDTYPLAEVWDGTAWRLVTA